MIRQKYFNALVAVTLLAGSTFVLTLRPVQAEELSAQQIIDGLKTSKTRSMSGPEHPTITTDDLAFVERVRGQTRSLTLDDRERLAGIVANRPKIDLEVNFDYNSAALSPKTKSQLNSLGKALTSPELAGAVIMVGGNTDAKGGEEFNQGLSEKRANAVKSFLIENYRVPTANLIATGYGKTHLKNSADPFAPENRRAQIANVAEAEQAAR